MNAFERSVGSYLKTVFKAWSVNHIPDFADWLVCINENLILIECKDWRGSGYSIAKHKTKQKRQYLSLHQLPAFVIARNGFDCGDVSLYCLREDREMYNGSLKSVCDCLRNHVLGSFRSSAIAPRLFDRTYVTLF